MSPPKKTFNRPVRRRKPRSSDALIKCREGRKRKCEVNEVGNTKKKRRDGRDIDCYCWICHDFGQEKICSICPRVYHEECLNSSNKFDETGFCPECQLESVDRAEITQTLPPGKLRSLIFIAMDRVFASGKNTPNKNMLMEWSESEENSKLCYIIDLCILLRKLGDEEEPYLTTANFFSDVKWIYHNFYVQYGADSTKACNAKKLLNAVKSELLDMEACPSCFELKSLSEGYPDFFIQICEEPHDLVWAKLKGFPYWPAKCLKVIEGMAEIRFFGTHDRAKIALMKCYRMSSENPVERGNKRLKYFEAIEEMHRYIENYDEEVGTFQYAPARTLYNPDTVATRAKTEQQKEDFQELSKATSRKRKNKVLVVSLTGLPKDFIMNSEGTYIAASGADMAANADEVKKAVSSDRVSLCMTSAECEMSPNNNKSNSTSSASGLMTHADKHAFRIPENVISVSNSPTLISIPDSSSLFSTETEESVYEANTVSCDNASSADFSSNEENLNFNESQDQVVSSSFSKASTSDALNGQQSLTSLPEGASNAGHGLQFHAGASVNRHVSSDTLVGVFSRRSEDEPEICEIPKKTRIIETYTIDDDDDDDDDDVICDTPGSTSNVFSCFNAQSFLPQSSNVLDVRRETEQQLFSMFQTDPRFMALWSEKRSMDADFMHRFWAYAGGQPSAPAVITSLRNQILNLQSVLNHTYECCEQEKVAKEKYKDRLRTKRHIRRTFQRLVSLLIDEHHEEREKLSVEFERRTDEIFAMQQASNAEWEQVFQLLQKEHLKHLNRVTKQKLRLENSYKFLLKDSEKPEQHSSGSQTKLTHSEELDDGASTSHSSRMVELPPPQMIVPARNSHPLPAPPMQQHNDSARIPMKRIRNKKN